MSKRKNAKYVPNMDFGYEDDHEVKIVFCKECGEILIQEIHITNFYQPGCILDLFHWYLLIEDVEQIVAEHISTHRRSATKEQFLHWIKNKGEIRGKQRLIDMAIDELELPYFIRDDFRYRGKRFSNELVEIINPALKTRELGVERRGRIYYYFGVHKIGKPAK